MIKKVFRQIYKTAKKENVKVYAVGGYVRDLVLKNKNKKDIDFVVIGSGLDFAHKLDEAFKEEGTLVEFPDFDTARYVFTKELKNGKKEKLLEIEFAGARTESYEKNSRKPKVISTNLKEDLRRRDFTINAMAREVGLLGLKNKIIDEFDGLKDLKDKIIKTPLDPDETFSEDPLRMLRAARFASQLGFEIEEKTLEAIKKNKHRLKIISAERIQEEFLKLLMTEKPSVGLWILYKTELFFEFMPEIKELEGVEEIYGQNHKNNLDHTFKVVDNVAQKTQNVFLRLASLLHDIGKPGTKKYIKKRGWSFDMHEHLGKKISRDICKRLKISKNDTEYICKLVRFHQQPIALMDDGVTDSPIRRLVVNLEDDLKDLLILCRSDITTGNPKKLEKRLKNYDILEKRIAEVLEKDKLRAFQSPLRGEEIMELLNIKASPLIGKIKKELEEAILDGIIPNEYEATKKYFLQIKEKYLTEIEKYKK